MEISHKFRAEENLTRIEIIPTGLRPKTITNIIQ